MVKIGRRKVDEVDVKDVGLRWTLAKATPKQLQKWVNEKVRKCMSNQRVCGCIICRIAFYMKYSKL